MLRPASLSVVLSVACLLGAACGTGRGDGGVPGATGSAGSAGSTGVAGSAGSAGSKTPQQQKDEQTYLELCAGCHGKGGEGVKGPKLRGWSKGREALIGAIRGKMPSGAPEACGGDCPERMADYILAWPTGVACAAPPALPRALRLLSRREYRNTVADLLQPGGSGEASCGQHTFTLDAQGKSYGKVHVAGTFNGWAKTAGEGGWAMTLDPAKKAFSVTKTLVPGTYSYKFVADESTWLTDPSNPNTTSDGFGGQNSVLQVSCGGSNTLPFDPTATLPVDTRPEGFRFDDHGASRAVTSTGSEGYWKAAQASAELAAKGAAKLVGCTPSTDASCAANFVRAFGRRAWRRPLTDDEVKRLAAMLTGQSGLENGVRAVVRAMLSSPHFLYRSEIGEAQADGSYRLTPYELASALSYTLWGTMPDDALLDAAAKGELATAQGQEAQARRLLAHPRAREALGSFAEQWLGTDVVETVDKNAAMFPEMTPELRAAMREETRRFVAHVVFDGTHRFDELLTADYTFANDKLAALYGISGVSGPGFGQAKYPDQQRSGVLGHGGVLATRAHSDQTSPIRRGLLVRRDLLCETFGAPPANAGGVPKVDPNATTRERFAQHSADPACALCHKYIDPVGFGFERFDAVGRLRDSEGGKPVDAQGDMLDVEGQGKGTHAPFTTLRQLGQTLAASDAARQCFVKQTWRYAHGAVEGGDELCAIDELSAQWAAKDHDVRELLIAVVLAPTFSRRK